MPVEKFSLYLWGYEYSALCLLSIQNSMPIELIVFILTLTCGHATSSSSADAEDGLLRSTTVNGETRIGADRDTVLCRSCGKGLADPHFLHTSQLSPEFLARYDLHNKAQLKNFCTSEILNTHIQHNSI